jgi:hypothetical protein
VSIPGLMNVPAKERDAQWLAYGLQEAIQLEWSTIPPYLCAIWSVNNFTPTCAIWARTALDLPEGGAAKFTTTGPRTTNKTLPRGCNVNIN